MKPDLEKQLVKKYPKLFEQYGGHPRATCMAWGCSCGDGWYQILDDLCEKLSKYDEVVLAQVKEKFGTLRIYIEGVSKEIFDKVHDYIAIAEDLSSRTCEQCGEPGLLRSGGWVRTLCNKCEDEYKSDNKWENLK